jgi:hypothetical protein
MLLKHSTTVTLALFVAFSFIQMPFAPAQESPGLAPVGELVAPDVPPPSCHVTLPSEAGTAASSPVRATEIGFGADGRVSAYGTEKLFTFLPTDGIWRGRVPSKLGDFAYENKLPWFRFYPGFSLKNESLTVTGKRLDGPAPSFTETFEGMAFADEGKNAMIMGGISIPVFGCWEITGHYRDDALTFVVWVAPLARESDSGESLPTTSPETAIQKTAPHRVHIDAETEARSLVYRLTPEIPHEAQVANVSGTVVLHAVIGTDGRAHELQYVSGPPLLARAAIDAVSWWQYRINDELIEVDTTIPVVFPPQDN